MPHSERDWWMRICGYVPILRHRHGNNQCYLNVQWNLQIKDTLGVGFCPFKRLLEVTNIYTKTSIWDQIFGWR